MKKILFFGDSNTWGHDPKDGTRLEKRWTVLLKELLPDCMICDDGVCGRATKYRVPDNEETDGITIFKKKYLNGKSDYDLVVIMLGTNDTLNCNNYTPFETSENLRIIINEYRKMYGNTKFLLVSPIHIDKCCMNHPIFSELYSIKSVDNSKEFAKYISKIASEENTFFMDASKYASPSPIDGIHMDEEEHQKLSEAFKKEIISILG